MTTRPNASHGRPAMSLSRQWSETWQAPVVMVSLLLLGGGFAVGHHYFYKSLQGSILSEDGSVTWQQRLNLSFGSTLAVMAKAMLVAAITSAYTQHTWLGFRKSDATVSAIDSKLTAISSIFSLLDPKFFLTSSFGTLLATLTWLVLFCYL